IAMEIDSFNNIKRLVAAGFGPSILPLYAVTEEVAAGSLRVSRIAAPGLWRGAHLMSPGGRPVTRALEAVHALLREVILDLRDKGAWAASRPPQVSGTETVS
ncbi:MAG: LysR substrate-binding domain-containing protein, partial [Pseudomonadota bacterium]|nr:LysR substrate-binding domain-containing protein [Pseudomonadota bacterium]